MRFPGQSWHHETDQKLDEGLCVGTPIKGGEVRVIHIIDAPIEANSIEDLDQITCQPGQIGEVIVKGPHVLTQYVDHPEAERRYNIHLPNESWHRTGDAGYLGQDGKLYLTGRCWSMIRKEERYYAPFLYENYFRQIEGVGSGTILEAAQGLLAIIELQQPSQRDKIRNRLEHLGLPYDRLVFLHKIPKRPKQQSKIDYQALREMLGE